MPSLTEWGLAKRLPQVYRAGNHDRKCRAWCSRRHVLGPALGSCDLTACGYFLAVKDDELAERVDKHY